MPQLRILCIGRKANDPLLQSADLYLQRLTKFTRTELHRLREGTPEFERRQLEGKLSPSDYIIALDERGLELRTREVAAQIEEWEMNGISSVTFLLGGADGLAPQLKERAKTQWALSRMTLPHRMAQVLLLEQLYRAYSINHGRPYHRE